MFDKYPRPGALIGLGGFKRSGKDTFAEVLSQNGWARDSFAGPLRRFTADLLGTNLLGLDTIKEIPQDALGGRTPRQVMQLLGTEWMREYCGQDVWLKALDRRIQPKLHNGISVVVTDVRFENEALYILSHGGTVVWIDRPGTGGDGHVSEAGIPAGCITHRISNDQDIHHLHKMAALFALMS